MEELARSPLGNEVPLEVFASTSPPADEASSPERADAEPPFRDAFPRREKKRYFRPSRRWQLVPKGAEFFPVCEEGLRTRHDDLKGEQWCRLRMSRFDLRQFAHDPDCAEEVTELRRHKQF